MKTITYDDTLYQLVPKETDRAMDDAAEQYYADTRNKMKGQWWWNRLYQAYLSAAPTPPAQPTEQASEVALNTMHPDCHKAADAFWEYWRQNGVPHKHGYYESTWGAINQALRYVGVTPHTYLKPRIEVKGSTYLGDCIASTPPAQPEAVRVPLTDDEIWKFWWARPEVPDGEDDSMEAEFVAACRRVLAAHGITAAAPKQEPGA